MKKSTAQNLSYKVQKKIEKEDPQINDFVKLSNIDKTEISD